MKMIRCLIWIFIWACPLVLAAQTAEDCGEYDRLVKVAQDEANRGNYNLAIKKYNAAKVCRPAASQTIDNAILEVFNRIQGERNRAREAEREAIEAQTRAVEAARINALKDKAAQITGLALDISDTDPEVALRLLQAAFDSVDYNSLFALRTMHELLDDRHHKIPSMVIEGHNDYVRSLSFSAYGNRIISSSDDGTVVLWSLNGDELATFRGHEGYVRCAAISPDGQYLVTGGDDTKVILWDINGSILYTYEGHADWIQDVAFAPDGQSFVSASDDGQVIQWDLQGESMQDFSGHNDYVYCVEFSPDGQSVAAGSTNGRILQWDLEGNKLNEFAIGQEYPVSIHGLAFTASGNKIISASEDGIARLWDASESSRSTIQQAERRYQGHEDAITFLSMDSKTETFITGGMDGKVILWSLNGEQIRTFTHGSPLLAGAISSDRFIVSAGYTGEIKLWDGAGYHYQYTYEVSTPIHAVAASPDGKYYLSGHEDGTAVLWGVNGERIKQFNGHQGPIRSVAFSPDSQEILTGSDDTNAIRWSIKGTRLTTYTDHRDFVRSVAFSPDGQQLLTGSDDGLAILWQPEGERIKSFQGHSDWIRSVAFSPDGSKVLTGSDDATAIIWNKETGDSIRILRGHTDYIRSVAFSPDGSKILTGSDDGSAILWNMDGDTLRTFRGDEYGYRILTVAFSPNSQEILAGGNSNIARRWKINGELMSELQGHASEVTCLTYSADGKTIMSSSWDGTVKLWDLEGNLLRNLDEESVITHTGGWAEHSVFSTSTSQAMSSAPDGVLLWNFTGKITNQYLCQGREVTAVAFPEVGPEILIGLSYGPIEAYHLRTLDSLLTYTGHKDAVTEMQYTERNDYFVSGSIDSTAILWSPSSTNPLRRMKHEGAVTNVAISADGNTIVTACDYGNKVYVWNQKGRLQREIEYQSTSRRQAQATGKADSKEEETSSFEEENSNWITDIDISNDGKLILIGNTDGKAQIWTKGGELVSRIRVPGLNGSYKVAFSSDGQYVITAGEYVAYLWHSRGNLHPIQTYRFEVPITSITFTDDNRSVLVGDQYMGFHRLKNLLWTLYEGDSIRQLQEEDLHEMERRLNE